MHLVITRKKDACAIAVSSCIGDKDKELPLCIPLQPDVALSLRSAALLAGTCACIGKDDLLDGVQDLRHSILKADRLCVAGTTGEGYAYHDLQRWPHETPMGNGTEQVLHLHHLNPLTVARAEAALAMHYIGREVEEKQRKRAVCEVNPFSDPPLGRVGKEYICNRPGTEQNGTGECHHCEGNSNCGGENQRDQQVIRFRLGGSKGDGVVPRKNGRPCCARECNADSTHEDWSSDTTGKRNGGNLVTLTTSDASCRPSAAGPFCRHGREKMHSKP
jgi:hypothetical protein